MMKLVRLIGAGLTFALLVSAVLPGCAVEPETTPPDLRERSVTHDHDADDSEEEVGEASQALGLDDIEEALYSLQASLTPTLGGGAKCCGTACCRIKCTNTKLHHVTASPHACSQLFADGHCHGTHLAPLQYYECCAC